MANRVLCSVLHVGVLEDVPDFVRSLIAVCRSVGCNIRAVLLDREFFSTRVLGTLGEWMRVIVPCMNTHVVVDAIAEFAAGKRPVASELYITNADGMSVRYAMITAERNKKRRKNTKSAGTDLRLEERFVGFATSMHLGDPEPYSKRQGIT